MQTSAKVMEMAGYYVGHSIWSLCDSDSLPPLVGYLEADDRHSLRPLAGAAPAIDASHQGAASIKVGRMGVAEPGRGDCLVLDVHFSAEPQCRLQYLLPFRSGQHELGFAIHRPLLSECRGFDHEQVEILNQFFFKGLAAHEQGGAVWHNHYQADIEQAELRSGADCFTLEELQLLRRAPLLVFYLLVGADGCAEPALQQRFIGLLEDSGRYLSPLLSRLAEQLLTDRSALAGIRPDGQGDVISELLVVRQVFEAHLNPRDSRVFSTALLALAGDLTAGLSRSCHQAGLVRLRLCLGLGEM